MARRKKASKRQTKWHLSGKKVKLARSRGHKPLKLLMLYHDRMETNLGKLERVIERRRAAGE